MFSLYRVVVVGSLSKSPPPPQPEILKASNVAQQQQQHQSPRCALDRHHTPRRTTAQRRQSSQVVQPQYRCRCEHLPTSSTPCTSKFDTRSVLVTDDIRSGRGASSCGYYAALGVGISADAPRPGANPGIYSVGRLFSRHRTPRCAHRTHLRPGTGGGDSSTMKRPASEVVPPVPWKVTWWNSVGCLVCPLRAIC